MMCSPKQEKSVPPLCYFIHDWSQKKNFFFLPFSLGSFSIEIRCSEYKTLTCCCQHSFPFFTEMRCWNPLQADKYLYTWLPDLIAFCKGDGVGVSLNAVPQYTIFFFCYPILCPSQRPHLNKNMSSMLGCPRKDWSGAEGECARCNRTHVTPAEWRCCILLLLFMYCACRVSVSFLYMESWTTPRQTPVYCLFTVIPVSPCNRSERTWHRCAISTIAFCWAPRCIFPKLGPFSCILSGHETNDPAKCLLI